MLSYSESTALGYEPESRKWGANGTLVEHRVMSQPCPREWALFLPGCRFELGHNVAGVGTVWHELAQLGGRNQARCSANQAAPCSAAAVILVESRRATLARVGRGNPARQSWAEVVRGGASGLAAWLGNRMSLDRSARGHESRGGGPAAGAMPMVARCP
jgi:hypothetical protein